MTQSAGILAENASGLTPTIGYLPAHLTWTDDAGFVQQFRCFVKTEDYDFGADITDHPVETGSNVTDNVRVKLDEAKIFFFETNTPLDDNNWASLAPATSIITIPSGQPGLPTGGLPDTPLEFNAWNNLITERALGATATGAIGGLLGGAMGSAVGTAIGEAVGEAIVGGGIPSPQVVFPPPPSLTSLAPPQIVQSQALGFGTPQDFVQLTISKLRQLLSDVQVVDLITPKLAISSMVIASIHVHRDDATGDAADIEVGLKEIRFVSTTTVPAPAPSLPRASATVNKGEQGTEDASAQKQSNLRAIIGSLGAHILP
jgi:hypothetical protein